ncbi:MAG: hypothetical protein SXA11_18310 [Cyanobacteriota bacterium]|nr:hypothetical protein [Cyanobacteriota bacterium]
MTIYHYIGYYIGSLIVFLRNSKGDVASATLRDRVACRTAYRPPYDPARFLQDLEEAGVISINN